MMRCSISYLFFREKRYAAFFYCMPVLMHSAFWLFYENCAIIPIINRCSTWNLRLFSSVFGFFLQFLANGSKRVFMFISSHQFFSVTAKCLLHLSGPWRPSHDHSFVTFIVPSGWTLSGKVWKTLVHVIRHSFEKAKILFNKQWTTLRKSANFLCSTKFIHFRFHTTPLRWWFCCSRTSPRKQKLSASSDRHWHRSV